MKVTDLIREKEENTNGLESINLYELKKVVVLTGANGSGKTRFLNTLKEMCDGFNRCNSEIFKTKQSLENEKIQAKNSASGAFSIKVNETPYINQINKLEKDRKNKYNISLSSTVESINIIDLSEELNSEYIDQEDLKLSEIKKICENPEIMNFQEIYKNVSVLLFYLYTEKYIKVHSTKYPNNTDKIKVERMIKGLTNIIKENLGKTISFTEDNIYFDNNSINSLSVGEMIILKLSVASFFKKSDLSNNIIIFDEPENHLHSKAIIDILDYISKSIGQIWIATHNLSIISHYYGQTICYLENGKIKKDGAIQIKVMDSLIGVNSDELRTYIDSAYEYGVTEFAYDCLFEPKAITMNNDDLQLLEFKEAILELLEKDNKEKINILDYGAGKGRLLSFLIDTYDENQLLNKLGYFAFDEYEEDKEICEGNIFKLYKNQNEKHYYNDIGELINSNIKFDIIILSNVLHEIIVTEWIDLFYNRISKILTNNGILLLLENSEMIIGENANEYGFLAIETEALKKLFCNENIDCCSMRMKLPENIKKEKIERVQAHIIKKEEILKVNIDSITNMLEHIKVTSKDKIHEIKQIEEKNLIQGKRLGFYYQQFASASMALEEMMTEKVNN